MSENLAPMLDQVDLDGSIFETIFIAAAGFEERCVASARKLTDKYRSEFSFVFKYDGFNSAREKHFAELKAILETRSRTFTILNTSAFDPIESIVALRKLLEPAAKRGGDLRITLDITALTKAHILMLLKMLDSLELLSETRIIYTEPQDYLAEPGIPMTIGVREIRPVVGYVSDSPLNNEVLLVLMLGYESERAMAVYYNFEPNKTLLLVPKPSYHPELDGKTEEINSTLVSLVGKENIDFLHPIDAKVMSDQLTQVLVESGRWDFYNRSVYLAPIGPKPQAVGIYLWGKRFPNEFSVVTARPQASNENFYSQGIGRTWIVLADRSPKASS